MVFVMTALVMAAPPAPRAEFAVEDGWLKLTVRQGGPVAGALIKAYDRAGTAVAEGETGDEGTGTFPAPRGHVCWVGITVGGKECDLVELHLGKAVTPSRVLLTFGTRPCCKPPERRVGPPEETEDVAQEEGFAVPAGVGGGLVALAGALALWRRPTPSPKGDTPC
jgi:hypothetical protein